MWTRQFRSKRFLDFTPRRKGKKKGCDLISWSRCLKKKVFQHICIFHLPFSLSDLITLWLERER